MVLLKAECLSTLKEDREPPVFPLLLKTDPESPHSPPSPSLIPFFSSNSLSYLHTDAHHPPAQLSGWWPEAAFHNALDSAHTQGLERATSIRRVKLELCRCGAESFNVSGTRQLLQLKVEGGEGSADGRRRDEEKLPSIRGQVHHRHHCLSVWIRPSANAFL